MTIERILIYVLAAGVIAWIVILTQPEPVAPLECPGTIYDERSTGGVRWCGPKQDCPKGPRGG